QSLTLGGIGFLAVSAWPLSIELGAAGPLIVRRCHSLLRWSALLLAVIEILDMAMQGAVLADSAGLRWTEVMGAGFMLSDLATVLAALLIAGMPKEVWRGTGQVAAIALGLVVLAASTATSHAAERLEGRYALAVLSALHQLAAGLWIGGIPYLLI